MSGVSEETLRRLLDDELSDEEREAVIRRLEEDPENRSLLRLEARLRELLSHPARRTARPVPERFAERVMASIDARTGVSAASGAKVERGSSTSGVTGWIGGLQAVLFTPRTLVWKPAHALAAAVALAALGVAFLLLGPPIGTSDEKVATAGAADEAEVDPRAPGQTVEAYLEGDTILVRFVYMDESAGSVAVAGDFTRWEPVPLEKRRRDGRAIWTGVVPVPRGEHRYMFVVDGSEWVTDPLAPAVGDDGFGSRNAILSL